MSTDRKTFQTRVLIFDIDQPWAEAAGKLLADNDFFVDVETDDFNNCMALAMARVAKIRNLIRRLPFDHDEMTQEELANRAGCTRQTIKEIKHVTKLHTVQLRSQLLKLFHVK